LERGDVDNNKRFYRCKTKDAELYEKLTGVIAKFITPDKLKELSHRMDDTQINESLNNTFSWLAPKKNKFYCGSQSLRNRLSIALGINALGQLEYYKRLFKKLSIVMTPNVRYYLSVKQTSWAK
jgi:hypothetical protein